MRNWLRTPLVVLLVGVIVSLLIAYQVSRVEVARADTRFEALADAAVTRIENKVDRQLTLIRGLAGYMTAANRTDRSAFGTYVDRLRLTRYYPGILGMGFASYHPTSAARDTRAAQIRASGIAEFRPWPDGARADYSMIEYLEPLDRRNRKALGFDMMSEATRRGAMERARINGTAALSGKVELVQEIDTEKQAGFLIYLPVYDRIDPVSGGRTPASNFLGWAYSPLRAGDLFSAVFDDPEAEEQVAVEIYDGAVASDNLLFASRVVANDRFRSVRRLDLAGHRWTVVVATTPAFSLAAPFSLALVLAVGGILLSGLVALLSGQQARAVARTERIVEERTSALVATNAQLLDEARAREAAENQVRQMQRMESIGQLTGGIAHDFNNMLAIIMGNLEMALRRLTDPDRLRAALEQASLGARRAAELTQQLLAFARRQPLVPRVIDTNAFVGRVASMVERIAGRGIVVATDLAADLPPIHADVGQLENALVNLAVNARDAMVARDAGDGGTLTIATARVTEAAIPTSGASPVRAGDYIRISVADSGIGMTDEVKGQALEPFFTTKGVGAGTGLGLSQVFGFVKQSGGYLDIATAPGEGTTVSIFLAAYAGDMTAEEEHEDAFLETPHGSVEEIILAVEDEEHVRRMSVEALRDLGYTVLHADSGAEALEILAASPGVRLLFTDVIMPGMTGPELVRETRDSYPDLKLLYTTGYSREEINFESRLEPYVQILPKPFTHGQLARKVRDVLDS